MSNQVRYGDMTLGMGTHHKKKCPHIIIGIVMSGSMDVLSNGLSTGRTGDITIHSCPHCPTGMLIGGSADAFVNNLPMHRLGDPVTEFCGMGISVTGSPNIYSNGGYKG